MPVPRTSEEATTEGTASDMGRNASVDEGRLSAGAVSGFPGSPATRIIPPLSMSTNGCSCLNASIIRCRFLYVLQFSPLEQ
ncbi:hypothetical protein RRF57_000189 [Xylaria bambusicola]|uniref:Uncharacterized protein n=1 Tax=Xylaria bambusicola TaxID=326684 RepID=A0AAN7Z2A0_9PEZI